VVQGVNCLAAGKRLEVRATLKARSPAPVSTFCDAER
jgi:hypothetical protein